MERTAILVDHMKDYYYVKLAATKQKEIREINRLKAVLKPRLKQRPQIAVGKNSESFRDLNPADIKNGAVHIRKYKVKVNEPKKSHSFYSKSMASGESFQFQLDSADSSVRFRNSLNPFNFNRMPSGAANMTSKVFDIGRDRLSEPNLAISTEKSRYSRKRKIQESLQNITLHIPRHRRSASEEHDTSTDNLNKRLLAALAEDEMANLQNMPSETSLLANLRNIGNSQLQPIRERENLIKSSYRVTVNQYQDIEPEYKCILPDIVCRKNSKSRPGFFLVKDKKKAKMQDYNEYYESQKVFRRQPCNQNQPTTLKDLAEHKLGSTYLKTTDQPRTLEMVAQVSRIEEHVQVYAYYTGIPPEQVDISSTEFRRSVQSLLTRQPLEKLLSKRPFRNHKVAKSMEVTKVTSSPAEGKIRKQRKSKTIIDSRVDPYSIQASSAIRVNGTPTKYTSFWMILIDQLLGKPDTLQVAEVGYYSIFDWHTIYEERPLRPGVSIKYAGNINLASQRPLTQLRHDYSMLEYQYRGMTQVNAVFKVANDLHDTKIVDHGEHDDRRLAIRCLDIGYVIDYYRYEISKTALVYGVCSMSKTVGRYRCAANRHWINRSYSV